MKKRWSKLITIITMIVVVLTGCIQNAYAMNELSWESSNNYYESHNVLVIEGFFRNNCDRVVKKVNVMHFEILTRRFPQETHWHPLCSADFVNIYLDLAPGQTKYWTFRFNAPPNSGNQMLANCFINSLVE